MKYIKFFILFSILASFSANAILEVNIIKSKEDSFPVVISSFPVYSNNNVIIKDTQIGNEIASIIRDDLNRSGHFNTTAEKINTTPDFDFWQNHKKDAIVIGKIVQTSPKTYNVDLYVYDVYTKKQLYGKRIGVTNASIRKVAHILSDKIYYTLLGQKGAFNTKLTYVSISHNGHGDSKYRLQISDADGYNQKTILPPTSKPILSPVWSSEPGRLRKIAYVSFENDRSEVFIAYPYMGINPTKLPRFDGIASSPSWHPDGDSIALTISKNGNKDIYIYTLKNQNLKRVTTNVAIDTEANFSPDGKSIAFTSNRTGQVQVYIKNLKSGKISRATFEGSYNAKPVFSPDGKDLALIHRVGSDYRLALLDIASRDLMIMTQNKSDESPFFSPNGGMIIYGTNHDNKGILSIISLHNNQTVEFMHKEGELREPSWSNYSN